MKFTIVRYFHDKFFYFTEKILTKNFFDKKVLEKKLYTFEFDEDENIIVKNTINLKNAQDFKFFKETTRNNLVERGFIEKIFGGIGKQPIPTNTF